jgi:hypothetical protein
MKSNLKQIAAVFLLVITGAVAGHAQETAKPISQIRAVKFNGDMAAFLAQMAQSVGITIGMETDQKKPRSEITLDLANVTFREILDGVVQSEPRYQWRENDGAIEVVPVNRTTSLIDTTITGFHAQDVSSEEAINQLLNLPEVRAVATSMKLNRRASDNPHGRNGENKISLDLSGVNLRQALTQIASLSGARFWIFQTFPDGTFSLGTSY